MEAPGPRSARSATIAASISRCTLAPARRRQAALQYRSRSQFQSLIRRGSMRRPQWAQTFMARDVDIIWLSIALKSSARHPSGNMYHISPVMVHVAPICTKIAYCGTYRSDPAVQRSCAATSRPEPVRNAPAVEARGESEGGGLGTERLCSCDPEPGDPDQCRRSSRSEGQLGDREHRYDAGSTLSCGGARHYRIDRSRRKGGASIPRGVVVRVPQG